VARIGVQVAEALAYAHRQGILHRDIKPSNLLLDQQGTVWITDFGLANAEGTEELTQVGEIVGTLRFMAPERFEGKSLPESDVYALGLTLYELLTLRTAFDDTNKARLIETVVLRPPTPPRRIDPTIPRDLETIVLKCLAKDSARRYATAESLAEDLRRFLADRPIKARPVGRLERAARWARRNPAPAALVPVSGLALLGLVTIGVGYHYNERLRAAFEAETESRRQAEEAHQAAEQQRREAHVARGEAEAALRSAQAYAYFHRIALADVALRDNNLTRAETLLDQCPAEKRHWEWHYLNQQCHADLLTIETEHAGGAYDIAICSDGKHLASAGMDGGVALWEADSGRKVWSRRGHQGPCYSVAFSPDRRLLATGGADGLVKLWEVDGGAERQALRGPGGLVKTIAFRPDGHQLAAAGASGSIRLWDVRTGTAVRSFQGHTGSVQRLAFGPNGRTLASASWDGMVRVWDVDRGSTRLTIRCGQGSLFPVAYSPDGLLLASGGMDMTIKLWSAADGKLIRALDGHAFTVQRLAFSPDGNRIASCSSDGTVRLWDVATGIALGTYRGHRGHVLGLAFHPEGHRLISAGVDGTIKQWDATSRPEALGVQGRGSINLTRVTFFSDGRRLLTAGLDHAFQVRDVASGRVLRSLGQAPPGFPVDKFLGVSSDGRQAALGVSGNAVVLRDPETDQNARVIRSPTTLTALALAPDARRLATGNLPSVIKVWDAATATELRTLSGHKRPVGQLAFSPDGRLLASVSPGEACKLWDVETGQVVRTFGTEGGSNEGRVAFSADGTRLAVATEDTIRLWDTETGRLIHTLPGHQGAVHDLAFHPDGRRLISGGMDRAVKLWDVETGQELLTLRGPENQVWGVAIDPQGLHIAATDQNQKLLIWSAEEPTKEWRTRRQTRSRDGLRGWQRDAVVAALGRGQWFAAEWFFDRLIAIGPAQAPLFAGRGTARFRLEKGDLAREDFRRAWDAPGASIAVGTTLALLCRRAGDAKAHREVIATLLKRFGSTSEPTQANDVAWACARFPDALDDFKQPLELITKAVKVQPKNANLLNTLGVVQYRGGQYKEAVATLERSLGASKGEWDGFDLFFLAMSHAKLGEPARAKECFDQAVRWSEAPNSLQPEQVEELKTFRAEAAAELRAP
jgi:WD40 repeat protein